jgi:hypothetical protein
MAESLTAALLEGEQARMQKVAQRIEQIDPYKSIIDVILDNPGSISLAISYYLLSEINDSDPSGRANVTTLTVLFLLMLAWSMLNSAVKRGIAWMAVSNTVAGLTWAFFMSYGTAVLTFLFIQYIMRMFTQHSQDGSMSRAAAVAVAAVLLFLLSVAAAASQQRRKLYAAR